MGHDAADDMSGDLAVWLDLVARLELPLHVDPAAVPWPARESLSSTPADQAAPGGAAAAADPDPPGAATERPESTAGTNSGSASSPAGNRTGRGTGADRSRVIRPASFMPFTAESAPVSPSPGAQAFTPGNQREHDDRRAGEQDDSGYETDAHFPGYDDDPDERYIPPPPVALPKLDPVARGAWTALFGGPGYLFIATLLDWQEPGWAELAAIIAFVAGFATLVFRLGDGPSRRDGPDQGAVV